MESAVSYWLKELQDFIQFSGRFDANIPRAIVGASKADIDRIEELAKLQIPPEYRAFLMLMGRTPPRALGNFLTNERYGVDAVVDYYSEPSARFHDAVFLWSFEIDSTYEFFISATTVPVIHIPHPILQLHWNFDLDTEEYRGVPGLTKVDESLLHYLYKNFFEQVRYPMFQHTIEARQLKKSAPGQSQNLTNHLQVVDSLAARFGFTKVPYTNSLELFYDRPNACLLYYPNENAPGRLLASGQDKDELTRICKIFCNTLDMQ